jgi:hypothetical protein
MVVVTVWVVDTALDTVSGVVTAGFVVAASGDLAAIMGSSGCKRRG